MANLRILLQSLYRGLKCPLQVGVTAAILTALTVLFLPNYYKSEARVLPIDAGLRSNLGGLAAAAAAFGVSMPGGENPDANLIDILNSRTLRERLLETEFSFRERPWRFGAERTYQMTLDAYLETRSRDESVERVGKIIRASRDLKTKVITLTAETRSPELSQQLVRRTLALLEAFLLEKGRTRGSAKAVFAEQRLGEARREMNLVEEDFRRFLNANRNYAVSADPSVRLEGLRLEAELKLRQQLVATLSINREQALMEEKNDIPILSVLDPGNLPIDKSRPFRMRMVLLAFLVSGLGVWSWLNRDWIKSRLLDPSTQER